MKDGIHFQLIYHTRSGVKKQSVIHNIVHNIYLLKQLF